MDGIQENFEPKNDSQTIEIDIIRLLSRMWQSAWFIAIFAIAGALFMFLASSYLIAPQYESTASVYIHDNTISITAGSAINDRDYIAYNKTVGEAADYLQNTYYRTLLSNKTLDIVRENLGLNVKNNALRNMIKHSFKDYPYFDITVTTNDPEISAAIANELAVVLYEQVSDIVGGSALTYVDVALIPNDPSSPNVPRNTVLGFLLGFIISCAIIISLELFDNKIYDDEYLINKYGIPVLASISDYEVSKNRKGYKYYSKYGNYAQYNTHVNKTSEKGKDDYEFIK